MLYQLSYEGTPSLTAAFPLQSVWKKAITKKIGVRTGSIGQRCVRFHALPIGAVSEVTHDPSLSRSDPSREKVGVPGVELVKIRACVVCVN